MSNNIYDKYGLVHTRYLLSEKGKLFLKNNSEIEVFLTPHANNIYPIILKFDLWDKTSLRLQEFRPMIARAPIFGVNFQKAIKQIIKNNFIKSKFSIIDKTLNYYFADLISHLNHNKEEDTFELQLWQKVDALEEVFYIHMIFLRKTLMVRHLDGARIFFDKDDLYKLLYYGKKLKGKSYEKYFKIDIEDESSNHFNLDMAIEMIRKYLPIEELANEFFIER